MTSRKQEAVRARRKMRSMSRDAFMIDPGNPPLAVMTCDRCGARDVNEDWLVMTRHRDRVSAGDLGICPVCVLKMFGPSAFKDATLLGRTRSAAGPRS